MTFVVNVREESLYRTQFGLATATPHEGQLGDGAKLTPGITAVTGLITAGLYRSPSEGAS